MTLDSRRLSTETRLAQLHTFRALPAQIPQEFQGPYQPPATIVRQAQREWLNALPESVWWRDLMAPGGGKMFGILVVRVPAGLRYLVAFSGKLQGHWCVDGFVPPIFDPVTVATELSRVEQQLQKYAAAIAGLERDPEYHQAVAALDNAKLVSSAKIEQQRRLNQRRRADRASLRRHVMTDRDVAALDQQSREDKSALKRLREQQAALLAELKSQVDSWEGQLTELRSRRAAISAQAQLDHFTHYQVTGSNGETRQLTRLFENGVPPGGAGDCAAPKLMQFAHTHRLQPLALAEFWLGDESNGHLRHHRQFYPPCRSRCAGLLRFMLPAGAGTEPDAPYQITATSTTDANLAAHAVRTIPVVFEDEHLLIIDKPAGVLSVSGKTDSPCVVDLLYRDYPELKTSCLQPVHRLDMDTSGLLIVARDEVSHRAMQQQFEHRQVDKRYVALLERRIDRAHGLVELPLRLDLEDRPRQQVCFKQGKPALTRFEVICQESERTRVAFFPVTGRTHQLRIHAAHPEGLHAAILGDPLYARPLSDERAQWQRLHLHASDLAFAHPITGARISVAARVPF